MQDFLENLHIPIEVWQNPILERKKVQVYLARLDKIHPDFGGNKLFKLKYNLQEARRQGKNTLLTFGGAYSNHIWATAAAGHYAGFETIGVIRGEEHFLLNPVLAQASAWGMELHYINRTDYRTHKYGENVDYWEKTIGKPLYIIPEGGSNVFAVKGCIDILHAIQADYDAVWVPCGTGATLAGLVASALPTQYIGVSVLKGGDFLKNDVRKILQQYAPEKALPAFDILTDYHFGGYAKTTPELQNFCTQFAKDYFELDAVYTAKMLYAIELLAQKDYFPQQARLLALVTQRQL